ncbi:DUF1869 domain-containing protein [Escherichia coli]|nr:DUF1869 domain-containing protein [Escherichia coli]
MPCVSYDTENEHDVCGW